MKIYHGGSAVVEKPEIRIGAYNKDFGQGFYCTEFQAQAERWAKRFGTPIVSVYEYDLKSELDMLVFHEMTDEWLDFIAACRNGEPHTRDIVIGAMANDQVWNYVADFISGILTREQFWVLAKFKQPTHQIAFCNTNALDCIHYIESYEVKQMIDNGREDRLENDLFFVCAVIEHIGRSTKNKRGEVVMKLGETEISRLLELAGVLHCEPIEVTSGRLTERCGLNKGDFDNVALCKYTVPTHFDIAKVYKRLVIDLANAQNITPLNALTKVYTSWISEKIDDYNSSMYFENPQYLYASYVAGKAIADQPFP